MDRITVIGYSNVGLSMALGLKSIDLKETEIVGTSGDRNWRDKAAELNVFDSVGGNLGDALRGANLVILDTPLSELKEISEAIGPVLEYGCIVTDTGLSMARMLEWADAYFRPDTTCVAGHPILPTATDDLDDANATLFEGVPYCLVPSSNARSEGVKTVVGLVEALGAEPLFMDAQEHDSYASAVTLMPSILASALMTTLSGSPSWREMSKLAGEQLREMSKFALQDPLDMAASIESNSETVTHWIDQMIGVLTAYRKVMQESRDEIEDVLIEAWEERAKWELGAVVEDSRPRGPSTGETVASMFIGQRLAGRMRDIGDVNKHAPWKHPERKTEPAK